MRNNIPSNNVSLLTPDLLTSLFNMNTVQSRNQGTGEPQPAPERDPVMPNTPPSSPVINTADMNTVDMNTLDEMEHLDLNIDIQKFDRLPNFDSSRQDTLSNFDSSRQDTLSNFDSSRRDTLPNFDSGDNYDRYLINDNE